jgi:hypothetical protein
MAFLRTLIVIAGTLTTVTASAAQLYWTDGAGIHRADTDGSGAQLIYPYSEYVISGLTADETVGKLFWSEEYSVPESQFPVPKIRSSNLDGSNVETNLLASDVEPGDSWIRSIGPLAVDPPRSRLFWEGIPPLDNTQFYISVTPYSAPTVEPVFGSWTSDWVGALFVDSAAGKVYQLDAEDYGILRTNFDGSEPELITDFAHTMAVDVVHGKIYRNEQQHELVRSNLDGSSPESFLLPDLQLRFLNMAVDPVAGHLYYAVSPSNNDFAPGAIYRSNLDGSGFGPILQTSTELRNIMVLQAVPEPSMLAMLLASLPLAYFMRPRRVATEHDTSN